MIGFSCLKRLGYTFAILIIDAIGFQNKILVTICEPPVKLKNGFRLENC